MPNFIALASLLHSVTMNFSAYSCKLLMRLTYILFSSGSLFYTESCSITWATSVEDIKIN